MPLWVADMDFTIAPSIREALRARLEQPIGYNFVEADEILLGLLRGKLERATGNGWAGLPSKGWVKFVSGVVPGLAAGVLGLTKPGDGVITMTPIYPPFLGVIKDHGRELRASPLVRRPRSDAGAEGAERWEIDWASMEAAVRGGQGTPAKLLMLCHPHNPCGRAWTFEELTKLAEFAERHDLFVVSDELHADLTLDDVHVPFVNAASEVLRARTLTLTGPCKTYNTAGLGIGAMIGHDAGLVARVAKANAWVLGHPTALSVAMWKAAMSDNGVWLATVLAYLRGNREFLETFMRERLPGVIVTHVEATYPAWLDYRAHPRAADIATYLLETAKVALNDGKMFGVGSEGFVRLNFATSRSILTDALERMARAR